MVILRPTTHAGASRILSVGTTKDIRIVSVLAGLTLLGIAARKRWRWYVLEYSIGMETDFSTKPIFLPK